MPPAEDRDEINRHSEIALVESVCERIREHLENERRRINEEIKNYPPPIPACDAQFNYLLEERAGIAQELGRLKDIAREDLNRRATLERLGEFITSSKYFNGEVEQGIRFSLLTVLDSVRHV